MDAVIRRELFKKCPVSRQAMNQRAKRLKEDYGPMTTDEAMYIIAHQERVDLAKHLPSAVVTHIRKLLKEVNSVNKSRSYLAYQRQKASGSETRKRLRAKTPTRQFRDQTVYQLLPNQSWDFVDDTKIRSMLIRDYAELNELLRVSAPKSTMVLCGSMLEAILVSILRRNEPAARAKYAERFSDKDHPNRQVPPLEEWGLNQLILVASALTILDDDSRRIANVLKDYRNLIHPMVEMRRQADISDENIAYAMLSLFRHILLVLSTSKPQELLPI